MMDLERREWEKAYAKRTGRFVEEQYVEDDDELEDPRPASCGMMGCMALFVAILFWILVGYVVVPILWPK